MSEEAFRQSEAASVIGRLAQVSSEAVAMYADMVDTMDDSGAVRVTSPTPGQNGMSEAIRTELYRSGLCQRIGDVWRVTNAHLFVDDLQDPRSWVYIIEAKGLNAVKIGRSRHVRKRVSDLQVGCPYELSIAARIPGDEHLERVLHKMFAPARIQGEWFFRSSDIDLLIEELRRVGAR